ncbi:MAG: hypothetical protein H6737_12195 [Alphaproteobacteria bacterium]|nr:hypothetical protein [Alphaproteobacteria bacterium]
MKNFTLTLIPLFAIACGVSDSKPLADIDSDLWRKICDAATDASAEETITCDGVEITIPAVTEEEASDACYEGSNITWNADDGCTFGVWVDCNDWDPADLCDPFADIPAACTTLAECATPAA